MKKAGRVLLYILFSLFAVADTVLGVVFIGATVAPTKGNDPLCTPIQVVLFTLCFFLMMLINIGGIARLTNHKKLVLPSTLLMNIFVGLSFGVIPVLMLIEERFYLIYGVVLLIGALFGLFAVLLGKHADRLSPDTKVGLLDNPFRGFKRFECIKAEWSWESAAKEYFGGEIPQDPERIDTNTSDRIHRYAAMPIASYLCWLLRRDMLSEIFYDGVPENLVADIKAGHGDPLALFECCDCTLTEDMLTSNGYRFTNDYFHKTGFWYNVCSDSFQFDYFDIIGGGKNYYVNEFSWEKQLELEAVLNLRLSEFVISDEDDDNYYEYPEVGAAHTKMFGEMTVYVDTNVDPAYIKRCIDHIEQPSEKLENALYDSLSERLSYTEEIPDDRQEVYNYYNDLSMYILPPQGSEPAYILSGGEEVDPEHGCELAVRGDYASDVCPALDVDLPWSESFEWKYRAAVSDREKTRRVSAVPPEFGGGNGADNWLNMPEVLADFKEICDRRIICLMKQGSMLKYSFSPTFDNSGRVIGLEVKAVKGDDTYSFIDHLYL
ncbi:MAG: hypothetical protein E7493_01850 [Ruminococcus albus]|nr:hypothetical protein [Ruminococcus albus]